MSRPGQTWVGWIQTLNSVDVPGESSIHRFILSARLGLWPAFVLSSFAFGHLLAYNLATTLVLAIDLCLAASIAFLFNDIRDAEIDSANHIHRWSIRSRNDLNLFCAA
ncbi:MAG TPA: hypothetical protein VGO47_12015, partial [Chlamydiales bacterium]|nr:hypothetical protein [Chlamydiales bacterium]